MNFTSSVSFGKFHEHYFETIFVVTHSCVFLHRLLTPENSNVTRQSRQAAKKKMVQNRNNNLNSLSDDVTSVRGGPDDDDNTVGGEAFADRDDISNLPSYKGWNAKYKLPINSMSIKSVHKNDVMITTEIRHIKHTRNLIFDSEQEAIEFVQKIEMQKQAEHERSRVKLQHALGGLKITPGEEVTLLVEIVSASDLPIADLKSSDPFVICFINDREVHRTDFISKNLNPVWTINTGSLFLFSLPTKELFMNDGLMCEVVDFDTLGNNEILGAIHIPPKTLYEATGQRMTFKLQKLPHSQVDRCKGSLSVRVRHATTNDKIFMKEFKLSNPRKAKTTKILANAGGKGELRSLVERVRKTEKQLDGTFIKKVKAN
jgi:C2 domain